MTYDTTYCSFERLKYGIKAIASTTSKAITIDSSFFYNNDCGIYLGGISYATIRKNTFDIREGDTLFVTDTISGIYLDECGAYMVEENSFFGQYSQEGNDKYWSGIGLVINNSGPYPNEIYNNYFEDCYVGTIAQNKNRDKLGINGLQILCNEYVNCQYDIAVTADDTGDEYGIKKDQGSQAASITAPAGNTFTEDPEETDGQYYCSINKTINYWHHSLTSGFVVIPVNISSVVDTNLNPNGYTFIKNQSCPSNIDTLGGGGAGNKAAMYEAEIKADSIQNLLNLLVDDGDTEQLTFEVQTSWPDDANELYNELIGNSPYLSDSVMISTAQKENVFPAAMVTDILSENPQSAKSDEVMLAVDQRINQLSDDQINQVNQGKYIIGAKESLESKRTYYNSRRIHALNNILRYYKNDTVNLTSHDSIINMLDQQNTIYAEYYKAFEYLQQNDTINLSNTLNDAPDNYELNTQQTSEHLLFEVYFDMMVDLIRYNKNIYELDSNQVNSLYETYYASQGILKSYTRNLLMLIDSLEYQEPYIFPDPELKTFDFVVEPVNKTFEENIFKLYPNPTHEYVIIEYGLVVAPVDGYVEFLDNKGILHKKITLINTYDYLVVDLSDLITGMYFCRFIIDGKIIETQKLSIIN